MQTIWLAPEGGVGDGAQTGDVVLERRGDVVVVCEVGGDGSLIEPVEVAASLLPALPEGGEWQRLDDEELRRAVAGVRTAEHERGG
jgi:hypothetical protein